MKKLIPLMLMTSCAGLHPCKSTCGIILEDNRYWTCEELQEIEDKSLAAFKATHDERLYTCNRANGYLVRQHDSVNFMAGGIKISGQTWCEYQLIELDNRTPYDSAFAHELVHVLQNCQPMPPTSGKPFSQEYYHSNWERDGIYKALTEVENAP